MTPVMDLYDKHFLYGTQRCFVNHIQPIIYNVLSGDLKKISYVSMETAFHFLNWIVIWTLQTSKKKSFKKIS